MRRPHWQAYKSCILALAVGLAGPGCVHPRPEASSPPPLEAYFQPGPPPTEGQILPDAGRPTPAQPTDMGLPSTPPPAATTAATTVAPVSFQQPAPQPPVTVWKSSAIDPPRGPKPNQDHSAAGPNLEPIPPPAESRHEPAYWHLDDMDIRKALAMATLGTHLNLIVSPAVDGQITANLSGLSPEQCIDALARLGHLVTIRSGGVLYVYTAKEADEAALREGRLPVRVYHLNYVRAADIGAMIKPLLSPAGKLTMSPASQQGVGGSDPFGAGMGATPGQTGNSGPPTGAAGPTPSTSGSTASNSGGDSMAGGECIVIRDQPGVLEAVDRVLTEIDVPPALVQIDAAIISLELDKDHQVGVNFAALNLGGHVLSLVGDGALINAAAGFTPAGLLAAGGQLAGNSTQGLAADEAGLKIGFSNRNLTGFIRALDSCGNARVLACPSLLVLNKQRADLMLGSQLGYTTLTQNGTSTAQQVEFLNVGTILRVRPFISSDGMVRMEVHPERSSGQVINNIPQTNVSQVTDNVMIPDGSTYIIGGLMQNVDQDNMSGVPILCNWPVIGALFRQRDHSTAKTELIVLLTPHIVHPPHPSVGVVAPAPACVAPLLGIPQAIGPGVGEQGPPVP